MANIGSLIVSLSARTEDLEKGLDKARKDLRKAHSTIDRLNKNLGVMGQQATANSRLVGAAFGRMQGAVTGLMAKFGALATVAGVSLGVALVKRTIAATDAIGKMADQIGIGVEALQELRFAASQSGIEQATLETSLSAFTRRIGEAVAGNKQLTEVFQKQLGIQLIVNGRVRSTSQLLRDVSNAYIRLSSQAEKAQVAQDLFGRSGLAMVNMLRLGANGMDALQDKARRLGLVLSEQTVRSAEAANDQIDIMQRILSAQLTRAVVALSPTITALGERVADLADDFGRAWEKGEGLAGTLKTIGRGMTRLADDLGWTTKKRLSAVLEEMRIVAEAIRMTQQETPVEGILGRLMGRNPAQHERRLTSLMAQYRQLEEKARRLNALLIPGLPAPPPSDPPLSAPPETKATKDTGPTRYMQILKQLKDQQDATLGAAQAKINTATESYRKMIQGIEDAEAAQEKLNQAVIRIHTPLETMQTAYADTFNQMQFATVNALQTMEDAFVQFAMTGKLNFKSMIDSILADLVRLSVRQGIIGPLSGALSGALNSAMGSLAGSGGLLGNLFGNSRQSTGQLASGASELLMGARRNS